MAQEWFDKFYSISKLGKTGLSGASKALKAKYNTPEKLNEIIEDETNDCCGFSYMLGNEIDVIWLTPAYIVSTLLYHGTIPIDAGEQSATRSQITKAQQMVDAEENIQNVACRVMMLGLKGYRDLICLRFVTTKSPKHDLTYQQIFQRLFTKDTGYPLEAVPPVETHKKLWQDAINEYGPTIHDIYDRIWNDPYKKARLFYTGDNMFSVHQFDVNKITTYELGQIWRHMMSTEATGKVFNIWGKNKQNLDSELGNEHLRLSGDERINKFLNLGKGPAPPVITTVKGENWFEAITGMPESKWLKDGNKWNEEVRYKRRSSYYITNKITGQKFHAGTLHHVTLDTLRAAGLVNKHKPHTPIHLLQGADADIRKIMIDSRNTHHMFQQSGQFNSLFTANEKHDISSNTYFRSYQRIKCQISMTDLVTPAMTICRRDHTYRVGDDDNFFSQTNGEQINYLKTLPQFEVVNGHANDRSSWLKSTQEGRHAIAGNISVVFNENAYVYFDITDNDEFKFVREPFPIHQICVSSTLYEKSDGESATIRQRFLLAAAYEATYLAALYVKAPELWLTLVGYTNSHDSLSLILEVINCVHKSMGFGLKVHLLDFGNVCRYGRLGDILKK